MRLDLQGAWVSEPACMMNTLGVRINVAQQIAVQAAFKHEDFNASCTRADLGRVWSM
jgi:hypothetical protein